MTTHKIFQIDAFADQLFSGNPAAIIPLVSFPSDDIMQSIALENNLSETAFVVARQDASYDLRWFTPTNEVDFCGHATIAASHALTAELNKPSPITFHTKIGVIEVTSGAQGYTMRTPIFPMQEIPLTNILKSTFDNLPLAAWHSRKNVFLMFPDAESIAQFQPDFSAIKALSSQKGVDDGVVIMAAGSIQGDDSAYASYDFVSRYFVPAFGIDEDPVTGSNHASLGPFWGNRLGKVKLRAYQASARGGVLDISVEKDHVFMTGQAVTYLRGEIYL